MSDKVVISRAENGWVIEYPARMGRWDGTGDDDTSQVFADSNLEDGANDSLVEVVWALQELFGLYGDECDERRLVIANTRRWREISDILAEDEEKEEEKE